VPALDRPRLRFQVHEVDLRPGPLFLGRDPSCVIRFFDATVSRLHA
jgi:hypothetical protein